MEPPTPDREPRRISYVAAELMPDGKGSWVFAKRFEYGPLLALANDVLARARAADQDKHEEAYSDLVLLCHLVDSGVGDWR